MTKHGGLGKQGPGVPLVVLSELARALCAVRGAQALAATAVAHVTGAVEARAVVVLRLEADRSLRSLAAAGEPVADAAALDAAEPPLSVALRDGGVAVCLSAHGPPGRARVAAPVMVEGGRVGSDRRRARAGCRRHGGCSSHGRGDGRPDRARAGRGRAAAPPCRRRLGCGERLGRRSDELHALRAHPLAGERLLSTLPGLRPAARIVRSLRERPDGRGYPDGLSGTQMPLAARILGACDAFVAMTSPRPHRAAMSREGALEEVRRGAGSQFGRDVAEVLVACVEGSSMQFRHTPA